MIQKNGIVIASAGNNDFDLCTFWPISGSVASKRRYPGSSQHTISVGAYQYSSSSGIQRWTSTSTWKASNFGECVDVWAPGSNILGARNRLNNAQAYGRTSGTSLAAPMVTGIVAMMVARDSSLAGDYETVRDKLRDNAFEIEACDDAPIRGCYGVTYTPSCPNRSMIRECVKWVTILHFLYFCRNVNDLRRI